MADVTVEVHKGIAEIIKLGPNIEVELVDVDIKAVVVYRLRGEVIEAHALTDEELKNHK